MTTLFTRHTTMQEVDYVYPFARSALYSKFHIGGCSNCGYEPLDTIESVAEKYKKKVEDVLEVLNTGLQDLDKTEISIADFKKLKDRDAIVMLVDVREDWEFKMARIPGSLLLNDANFSEVVERAKRVECVVVVCHHGLRALNAALYLRENGIKNARSLQGGIDAYSLQMDSSVPRY